MLKQEEKETAQQSSTTIIHFSCARSRLNHGLTTVARAVSKNSIDIQTMPLLGCIRLEVKDGFLILAVTDLNISITSRIELTEGKEDIQEGVVAVPARMFIDLIGKMRDGQVTVSVAQDYMLYLTHSRGTAQLKCLDAEEYFPIPHAEDGELPVLLPVIPLKEMVREISIAAAKDDAFPALTCLFIHVENNKVVFAATDRYRTAHRLLPLPTDSKVTYDLLVPHRSLGEFSSILPNDGMVMMSITPNRGQVIFHTQWITFSSRLLEGAFPNYAAAIPKREERKTRIVVKTEEFKEIVQLTAPYANAGGSGMICLSIKGSQGMEPGSLTVASEQAELGSGQNSVTAAVEGDDQEEPINFNYKLLLDALDVVSTPEVSFEIGIMKVRNNEGESFSAPAGVLKPVGQNTSIHSFMSLSISH